MTEQEFRENLSKCSKEHLIEMLVEQRRSLEFIIDLNKDKLKIWGIKD